MKEQQAAVALILVPGRLGPECMILHRAEHPLDPWSGHMCLPGGRRERNDRDLARTAMRETLEETGLRLSPAQLRGVLKDLRPRNRDIPKLLLRPHVFALTRKPKQRLRPLRAEVAECLWVPLARLRDSRCRIHVPERRRSVDAYLVGSRVIWGITYRILEDFLGREA